MWRALSQKNLTTILATNSSSFVNYEMFKIFYCPPPRPPLLPYTLTGADTEFFKGGGLKSVCGKFWFIKKKREYIRGSKNGGKEGVFIVLGGKTSLLRNGGGAKSQLFLIIFTHPTASRNHNRKFIRRCYLGELNMVYMNEDIILY